MERKSRCRDLHSWCCRSVLVVASDTQGFGHQSIDDSVDALVDDDADLSDPSHESKHRVSARLVIERGADVTELIRSLFTGRPRGVGRWALRAAEQADSEPRGLPGNPTRLRRCCRFWARATGIRPE